jgi:hypothetical protein
MTCLLPAFNADSLPAGSSLVCLLHVLSWEQFALMSLVMVCLLLLLCLTIVGGANDDDQPEPPNHPVVLRNTVRS